MLVGMVTRLTAGFDRYIHVYGVPSSSAAVVVVATLRERKSRTNSYVLPCICENTYLCDDGAHASGLCGRTAEYMILLSDILMPKPEDLLQYIESFEGRNT